MEGIPGVQLKLLDFLKDDYYTLILANHFVAECIISISLGNSKQKMGNIEVLEIDTTISFG